MGEEELAFCCCFAGFLFFQIKRFLENIVSGNLPPQSPPPRTHLLQPLSQVASRGLVAATLPY